MDVPNATERREGGMLGGFEHPGRCLVERMRQALPGARDVEAWSTKPSGMDFADMTKPIHEATLSEVRVGRVRRLGETDIMSAIAKTACRGPVRLSASGAEGDEQGNTVVHGGPEKALLQYPEHHYAAWRGEFPASAHLFVPGGFGENLVAGGLDESSVCIGDVVEVGSAVLQVAQPRQPCFKLNHRFQIRAMSRRTQDTRRTGWYYRVLGEGTIVAGDTLKVVGRPHPEWSVSRVQHHLYADTGDSAASAALADLQVLALAMRSLFRKRVASRAVEQWEPRLLGSGIAPGALEGTTPVVVEPR